MVKSTKSLSLFFEVLVVIEARFSRERFQRDNSIAVLLPHISKVKNEYVFIAGVYIDTLLREASKGLYNINDASNQYQLMWC